MTCHRRGRAGYLASGSGARGWRWHGAPGQRCRLRGRGPAPTAGATAARRLALLPADTEPASAAPEPNELIGAFFESPEARLSGLTRAAGGKLEAVGYSGGRAVARDVRETSGPASAIRLALDRRLAKAGEVVIANAMLVDARGRPVPTADNLLRFRASGGEVIGVGNGNPNSLEPDVATERRAFNGLAQAIVRVGRGPVDVSVASDGLVGSRMRIMAI